MPELSPFPLDDSATADEELDAAAVSVLAAASGSLSTEAEAEPFGMTWLFDFDAGRFVRRGGSPVEVYGVAGLPVWANAAIRTPRAAYRVFTDEFGRDDPDSLIGALDPAELLADYEEQIREALTVHDRIADVTEFEAYVEGDAVYVNFVIVTDAGETQPVSLEVPR